MQLTLDISTSDLLVNICFCRPHPSSPGCSLYSTDAGKTHIFSLVHSVSKGLLLKLFFFWSGKVIRDRVNDLLLILLLTSLTVVSITLWADLVFIRPPPSSWPSRPSTSEFFTLTSLILLAMFIFLCTQMWKDQPSCQLSLFVTSYSVRGSLSLLPALYYHL